MRQRHSQHLRIELLKLKQASKQTNTIRSRTVEVGNVFCPAMLVWTGKRILDKAKRLKSLLSQSCCVWENIRRSWNHSQTWIRVKGLRGIKPVTMPDSDPVSAVTSDGFRTCWCFKVDEFNTAWQGRGGGVTGLVMNTNRTSWNWALTSHTGETK